MSSAFVHRKSKNDDDDNHLRRLAVQIATQLPEDQTEATRVLEYTQALIDEFLFGTKKESRPALVSVSSESD
jgi:hypothetical protein